MRAGTYQFGSVISVVHGLTGAAERDLEELHARLVLHRRPLLRASAVYPASARAEEPGGRLGGRRLRARIQGRPPRQVMRA